MEDSYSIRVDCKPLKRSDRDPDKQFLTYRAQYKKLLQLIEDYNFVLFMQDFEKEA